MVGEGVEWRVTPMEVFAFHLNVRDKQRDYLFQMGRLFQELIISYRIAMDNSRLMWQLTHQVTSLPPTSLRRR